MVVGDGMAVVGPGRRWVPMFWLEGVPVGEGFDKLTRLADGGHDVGLVSRDYEYRLLWDQSRSMWRLDRRRTASGG